MRRGVDKVGEGDESGGEADGGPVERGDEDLGVRVEGVCDVEVVGDEGFEPHLALVGGGGVDLRAKGYVCAAVGISVSIRGSLGEVEGEAYAEKNRPFPVRTVMNTSSRSATSFIARASW